MEEKFEYSPDVYQKLGDAIVWTTILAAVHKDGVIEVEERAEAIKQAHIRVFSTEPYIKPIYAHLDENFEGLFDTYSKQLPEEYEEKERFIKEKLADCMSVLKEMGPVFTSEFSKELASVFDRVFTANATLVQSFLFPFISGHLSDKNNDR